MASSPTKIFTMVTILAVLASYTALLASAAAPLGSPANRAAALTGPPCCFAENCLTWSLDSTGHVLRGTCYDKLDQRGHWKEVTSSLDLGNCVGNFNGILMPASAGAYSESCVDCALQGTSLTCKCRTHPGDPGSKASVDLNAFVQDSNGRLKCFNYDGTVSNGA